MGKDKFEEMSEVKIRKYALPLNLYQLEGYEESSKRFKSAIDHNNFWRMKLEHDYPIEALECYDDHEAKEDRRAYVRNRRMARDRSIGSFYVNLREKTEKECKDLDDEIRQLFSSIHENMYQLEKLHQRRERRFKKIESRLEEQERK